MNTRPALAITIPEDEAKIVFDFTADAEEAFALENEESQRNAAAIGYEVLHPDDMFDFVNQIPPGLVTWQIFDSMIGG